MNHITYIARFISPFPRWRQTNENKMIFIYFVNLFQVFTTGFDLFTGYRHETGHINVLPDPEPFIGKCLGIRLGLQVRYRTPRHFLINIRLLVQQIGLGTAGAARQWLLDPTRTFPLIRTHSDSFYFRFPVSVEKM